MRHCHLFSCLIHDRVIHFSYVKHLLLYFPDALSLLLCFYMYYHVISTQQLFNCGKVRSDMFLKIPIKIEYRTSTKNVMITNKIIEMSLFHNAPMKPNIRIVLVISLFLQDQRLCAASAFQCTTTPTVFTLLEQPIQGTFIQVGCTSYCCQITFSRRLMKLFLPL